tara:strand:- start:10999 stop:11841 length:843 start_codon:yes stop_codon:yes gene_type:complete
VVGHPIEHSISPDMHNAALSEMAEGDAAFREWKYFRFDIPPALLSEAIPLFHSHGFRGINLTLPHKVQVLDLLKEIDPVARKMMAVNTLNWQPDGYYGYNSDGFGLSRALESDLGATLADESVIILGAGGAARAAAVHCLECGCRELWIGNRSVSRLKEMLSALKEQKSSNQIKGFDLAEIPRELPSSGILINATSLGLKEEDPSPIDLNRFDCSLKVFDMIYSPPRTKLMKNAEERGVQTANGFSMLVWQGFRSMEIWSQTKVPVEAMFSAGRRAVSDS